MYKRLSLDRKLKTNGSLDSRLDRMVHYANMSFVVGPRSAPCRRRRVPSEGSSSTISYDAPKTPADVNNNAGQSGSGEGTKSTHMSDFFSGSSSAVSDLLLTWIIVQS